MNTGAAGARYVSTGASVQSKTSKHWPVWLCSLFSTGDPCTSRNANARGNIMQPDEAMGLEGCLGEVGCGCELADRAETVQLR